MLKLKLAKKTHTCHFLESSMIGSSVKQAINDCLAASVPMLVKMDQVTTILEKAGLAWKDCLKVSDLLTHPQNRGGQMLGVEDVHLKGFRLLSVGLKKELLQGSVAFEVSQDPVKRQEQFQANKSLVKQSMGLLAPVSSKERFLTVGTSHTAAFFKAIQAGCYDAAKADAAKADLQAPVLQDILENGWEWLVLSSQVEQQFPDLPRFYSLALNAHISGLKQMTEVEAAAQIALGVSNGLSLKAAIEEIRAADPQCKASLDAIGFYCSHFGGGDGMPLINFLSKMSTWTFNTMAPVSNVC